MGIEHGKTRVDTMGSFGWRDEFTIPAGTSVKRNVPDCDGNPFPKWVLDEKTAIALSGNTHDPIYHFVIVESHLVEKTD